MAAVSTTVHSEAARVVAGRISVEIAAQPFSLTIRRDDRSVLRGIGAWAAGGVIRDRSLALTEGVGGEAVVAAPLERIPVWVRAGAMVLTHPADHVAAGLGDVAEADRPLVATLWGEPRCGRALARMADGTRVG